MSIPTEPDTTPTPLFNPLPHTFTWEYMDDNNDWQKATMPSASITYFPKWLADMVKPQLAYLIYGERGFGKTPIEDMKKIIAEEIEVVL